MKLINKNPLDYLGRTVLFRHQAFQIDGADESHILVSKPGLNQKGKLRPHLFAQCHLYPTNQEIAARYPKLIRALRSVCNLTTGEAENAVLGMLIHGSSFKGSEALAHIGGAGRAIWLCWTHRKRVRESFAQAVVTAA